jgi:uncharacterized membrane protein YhaH (DUF805 family)
MLEAFLFLSGRLGRLAYFGYSILLALVLGLIALVMIWPAYNTPNQGLVITVAVVVVGAIAIWCGICLAVKRLHDLDLSGWHYAWMALVPGVINGLGVGMQSIPTRAVGGVLSLGIGLYLLLWPGTDGMNRFGYRP